MQQWHMAAYTCLKKIKDQWEGNTRHKWETLGSKEMKPPKSKGLVEATSSCLPGSEAPPPHPLRTQSCLPRDLPQGKKKRKQISAEPALSSSAFPSSDVGRFLLSSTYWIGRKQLRTHLIFNGSSCFQDTEEQSKRTESTRKQKCPFFSCYFFFLLFFWKSNACVRALEMWTPDLQIFRHVSQAICPWLGKAASVKRSLCSAGALQDRGVVGAETSFSKPISKHSPLAMNPRETKGREQWDNIKNDCQNSNPCQQSSSTLNLKYHGYTILSDFLLIAFSFIFFFPIWKYSQTPKLFLNNMLVKPNSLLAIGWIVTRE